MTNKRTDLQDSFINYLRKERITVTIYLMNGTRLKGVIKGFDNFVIILKQNVQQMIYKHAISTISPDREVNLKPEQASDEG